MNSEGIFVSFWRDLQGNRIGSKRLREEGVEVDGGSSSLGEGRETATEKDVARKGGENRVGALTGENGKWRGRYGGVAGGCWAGRREWVEEVWTEGVDGLSWEGGQSRSGKRRLIGG